VRPETKSGDPGPVEGDAVIAAEAVLEADGGDEPCMRSRTVPARSEHTDPPGERAVVVLKRCGM